VLPQQQSLNSGSITNVAQQMQQKRVDAVGVHEPLPLPHLREVCCNQSFGLLRQTLQLGWV
jgi:hypothetical protein